MLDDDAVIHRVTQWAETNPQVRAVLLTSSRANPGAPLDRLSDHDIMLIVGDTRPFLDDESWLRVYGAPMVLFRDSGDLYESTWYTRLVVYEDAVKVDYTLWTADLFRRALRETRLPAALDVGYRVLVDKDGLTKDLPPPSYTAHIPRQPTEEEYRAVVEEFWWESTYVAKNLWRDELYAARYSFEVVMRHEVLLQMLEWHIQIDRGWSVKPGAVGRGLKRLLSVELWALVEATFAGPAIEENWDALFHMTELFRRLAVAVGEDLGHTYPHELDRSVTRYLSGIRHLPKENTD